jgi:predicted lactoylglutathione lyase
MYSRGIEDPDGHGLGPFWMDANAAPAAQPQAETAG